MTTESEGSTNREKALEELKSMLLKEGKEGVELAQASLDEETAVAGLETALLFTRSRMRHPSEYFRTALLSLFSKVVGGTSEDTISTGASLVLFARAIGIHDDIIDHSKTKDGKLTTIGKLGRDIALVLSDILLFKGFTLFRKTLESGISTDSARTVLDVIEKIWFEQSEGEVLEIQSRGQTNVSLEDCMRKIRMRASEMEACGRIGGILGGGSMKEVASLGVYGRMLGMASILRNELIDLLDLKALDHRIRNESLPLPLVFALRNMRDNSQLVALISQKHSKKNLKEISGFAEESGGMQYTSDLIYEIVQEGLSSIEKFKNKDIYKQLNLVISVLPVRPEEWKPFYE